MRDDELITLFAQMRKNGASGLSDSYRRCWPGDACRQLCNYWPANRINNRLRKPGEKKSMILPQGFQPTAAHLRAALHWVKDPILQRRWSERLLAALPLTARVNEERLKLLAAIAHDGLRDERLMAGIIAAINAQQIPLASQAIKSLTPTTQIVWQSVIGMIKVSNLRNYWRFYGKIKFTILVYLFGHLSTIPIAAPQTVSTTRGAPGLSLSAISYAFRKRG